MSDAVSPPPDLTGRTLGDFHVLRKLGQGGMGQVYLARQVSLKRDVALKLLRTELSQNDTMLKRFQAEAEAVARISHPNIVQVYAVGEHDGLRFMALEYVDGRNLRDYLDRKGPPDLPVALAVIRQVAAALQRAHEVGIVHRDIKPENILLTKKVDVKVTDFGLSRLTSDADVPLNLTQSGMTLGTPLYMAPEQVRGLTVDHRTDLYSFGVTCYHLLAGEPPFQGANAMDVALKHVNDAPVPLSAVRPDLPADLCQLVAVLMAKSPADRYQSAKDVLRDVAKIRDGLALNLPAKSSIELPVGSTVVPVVPPAPTDWTTRILGGVVLAGLFAAGWVLFDRTQTVTVVTPAGVGLPADRLPDAVKLVSDRERDLIARRDKRGAPPAEIIDVTIELGLLYVEEHRLDDAGRVFEELQHEKFDRVGLPRDLPTHKIAAQFGLGIVLAHQDKVRESIAAFQTATNLVPKNPIAQGQLQQFLAGRRDLTLAVAGAVQRDADNLNGEKLPPMVDRLRTPGSVLRDGP